MFEVYTKSDVSALATCTVILVLVVLGVPCTKKSYHMMRDRAEGSLTVTRIFLCNSYTENYFSKGEDGQAKEQH